MRTVIAGSRSVGLLTVRQAMAACPWADAITVVISGKAPSGADLYGEVWAKEHELPIEEFPADWDRYGRGAGMRRNCEMAVSCEALVAIWDGVSPGTKQMIQQAERRERRIFVWSPECGEMKKTGDEWVPVHGEATE